MGETNNKMKPYEILGLPLGFVDPAATIECIALDGSAADVTDTARQDSAEALPIYYHLAALRSYLVGDTEWAARYGAGCIERTLDYFYGTWRSEMAREDGTRDASRWRSECEWISHFECAMLWAAVLRRWGDLERLAAYPDEDCPPGAGGPDEVAFYLALAFYLRGQSNGASKQLKTALDATAERVVLLGRMLEGIVACDSASFAQCLSEYMTYYVVREFPKGNINKKVAMNGTSLLALARHAGMNPTLDEKYRPYIVSLRVVLNG